MPTLTFSANADVYHHLNSAEGEVTLNPDHLKPLHGMHSTEYSCSECIDVVLADALELTGGEVRFYYDESTQRLRVSTCYGITFEPSDEDLQQLQEETEAQWSDGIGTGSFAMLNDELLSRSLALAWLNEDPEFEALYPEFTVDAFPFDDRDLKVEWSADGKPFDNLVNDLKDFMEQGNPIAKIRLGEFYLSGHMGLDYVQEGLELLTEAASDGNEEAVVSLADSLLEGVHIPADPDKAIELYEQAMSGGSMIAAYHLGEAYKEGDKLPRDPDKAIQYLEHASELGFGPAIAELGDCYEFGLCVEKDLEEALSLYSIAYESGFDPVLIAFERVSLQLGRELPPYRDEEDHDEFDDPDELVESPFFSDHPELAEAIREAQGSLQHVIDAIQSSDPETKISIFVNLDPEDGECNWLSELKFEYGKFIGTLTDEPFAVSDSGKPTTLAAHPNEVVDWIMTRDGNQSGGFTIEIFKNRDLED